MLAKKKGSGGEEKTSVFFLFNLIVQLTSPIQMFRFIHSYAADGVYDDGVYTLQNRFVVFIFLPPAAPPNDNDGTKANRKHFEFTVSTVYSFRSFAKDIRRFVQNKSGVVCVSSVKTDAFVLFSIVILLYDV